MRTGWLDVAVAKRPSELDEQASYAPGEPMDVTVTFHLDEPTKCGAIDLVCRVEGKGRGFNPDIEAWRERLFDGGELPAGDHVYRCRKPAPQFPPTYVGSHIGVHWVLEATADIPWGKDYDNQETFELKRPPTAGLDLTLPPPEGPEHLGRGAASRSSLFWGTGCTLVLPAILVAVGSFMRSSGLPEDQWGPFLGFGILGLVGVGGIGVVMLVRRLFVRVFKSDHAPIDVAVALERTTPDGAYRQAPADDALVCTVVTKPDTAVSWMKARLEICEHAEWQESNASGEGTTTRTFHEVQAQRVGELRPTDTPGQWRGRILIPDEELPYSVSDPSGDGLIWQVQIFLEHGDGKKPLEPIVRKLVALPSRAEASAPHAR